MKRVAEIGRRGRPLRYAGYRRSPDSARAPVVTIMGHVDHGKTSLLDAFRNANVVSGEAGGITQHIGAYQVVAPSGQLITFIDTPGHAAFTAMRARGAKVTDIVVLVVAADDGVMPQTAARRSRMRAPRMCRSSSRSTRSISPTPSRNGCARNCCTYRSAGRIARRRPRSKSKCRRCRGSIISINCSRPIALQSEVLDLKANPDRSAEGTVIEASLDRGRGPVATVLVQRGTL